MDLKTIKKAITKCLEPIQRRVMQMIGRCVLSAAADDSKGIQLVQITGLSGETMDAVERFQQYGFTSNPLQGAEGIVLSLSGNRDHSVCIAADDRRYRIKNLEPGEVAIYTDEGDKVEFKRGGIINIVSAENINITTKNATISSSEKTVINATTDVEITGENCKISASTKAILDGPAIELGEGATEAVIKGTAFQTYFNSHTHNGNLGAPTGPPIVSMPPTTLSTQVKTK